MASVVNERAALRPDVYRRNGNAINVSKYGAASLARMIRSIFAYGEQGFAYDPNDLTTLYQDAAGTVPVTGAGQPVGLMLDKSKGLALGAEKSTISVPFTVYRDATTNTLANIANVEVGKSYFASITLSSVTSTKAMTWRVLGQPLNLIIPVQFGLKAGTYNFILTPKVSGTLEIFGDDAGVNATFSAISVKELTGNHAYQTVSASRPILQRNATTGAYYLAFDGTDDFLVTNSIDFTAKDEVSLFAGVRIPYGSYSEAFQVVAELSTNIGLNAGTFTLTTPHRLFGDFQYSSRGTTRGDNIFSGIATEQRVITAKSKISSNLNSVRANGGSYQSTAASQGTGNYGNYPLYIGRRGGTTLPFSGHLYSLIGIGRLTTDSETIALEKSIAKNTGVTLNV